MGEYFEETEEGDDPGGLFLGIKKIGLRPQSSSSNSEYGERSGNGGIVTGAAHDPARESSFAGGGGFWPGSFFVQTHRGLGPIPDVEAV
jgi:hypothetical protein